MRKSRHVTRHGTISMLNMLLGREEEAVHAALEVSINFSKEICKLLCSQTGVEYFNYSQLF
jgi:hypothetical protein